MTPRTITQPDRFLNGLARVRKAGYTVDNEELSSGMRGIAAPVLNEQSDAAAASPPRSRIRPGTASSPSRKWCGLSQSIYMRPRVR
jgi:DNA-binding IclR family transcriptional regulator